MKPLVAYLSTALVFGVLDAIWLGVVSRNLYRPALGEILAAQVRWPPAIAFYLIYILGVVALVVMPALREASLARAAWSGALFGFVAYATYDLTNQATLRVWPLKITLIDMAWGAFATGVAATLGYLAVRLVLKP